MRADFNYGDSVPVSKLISFTGGYLWNPRDLGTQDIFDFSTLINAQNKSFLCRFLRASHSAIDNIGISNISIYHFVEYVISSYGRPFVNTWIKNVDNYVLRSSGIKNIFVPKFYHNIASTNFFKKFVFVKGQVPKLLNYLSEQLTFGRVLYEYVKKNPFSSRNFTLNADDNKFLFPEKWHKTKGYSVYGFSFAFKKLPSTINNILKPTDNSISDFQNGNTEEVNNGISTNSFFDEKTFHEKVEEFKAIPKKEFINESFFLCDKSNTIKRIFITALNKELSIYGSLSYFSGRESAKNIKLVDISNHLKFLVEKKTIRKNLKLHLAYVNEIVVKTKDQKIHDFSITRLGKRQKSMLSTPIETIIIRAQQDFDVVGGLNPAQVEITDSRIINKLPKFKNSVYKITPLSLHFPASITNDTNHIIITSTKISGAKKEILNYRL